MTLILILLTYNNPGSDIEFDSVVLTGCARAKLRRHPRTNTTFSMVTVVKPVEKKIMKTP